MTERKPEKSALARFIAILARGSLLSELTDEDIADTLWLAQQMGEVKVVEDKPPPSDESDESDSDDLNLENIDNSTTVVDSEDKVKLIPEDTGSQDSEEEIITETLPIQVPEPPVLPKNYKFVVLYVL